jgi:hypothetical protein
VALLHDVTHIPRARDGGRDDLPATTGRNSCAGPSPPGRWGAISGAGGSWNRWPSISPKRVRGGLPHLT